MKVVFLICENMLLTSLTLPMEQLRAADEMYRREFSALQERKALDITIASVDGEAKPSHTGIKVTPDFAIADITQADIIFLPALWRNPAPVLRNNSAIADWLLRMNADKPLIAGVGTGCCFIAESGLLDGLSATTHWHYFDQFKRRYPKIKLQKRYFITRADNIFCTGSVNSLADLTVYFIGQFYSSRVSELVERNFFHAIRQAYDREAFSEDLEKAHPDELVLEAQAKMRENLRKPADISALAKSAGLSRRSFDRRFKSATGSTPLNYLQKIRLSAAKDLLTNSNLSIQEIMYECAYQDASYFSEIFKRHFGASPREYRTTVRAKLFK